MNDDPNQPESLDAVPKLKHEKTIAPINPDVHPETPPASTLPVSSPNSIGTTQQPESPVSAASVGSNTQTSPLPYWVDIPYADFYR